MILSLLVACDVPVPEKKLPVDDYAPCTTDGLAVPLTYAPTGTTTMKEDDQGVVHIYAQDDQDLFYAAGYEQARQRLYQIDRARLSTRGTLSELDGESAVNTDLIARTFNLLELGCRTLRFEAQDRPDDLALGVAFVAGLNRFVDDLTAGTASAPTAFGQDQLHYIPEPFTVVDIVAMGKRITLGYSNQLEYDLLVSISDELVNDFDQVPVWTPARARYIVDGAGGDDPAPAPAPSRSAPKHAADFDIPDDLGERLHELTIAQGVGHASNNWVFAGKHTANGKPVMANDPHASLSAPSMVIAWHLNSADAGGNFDVAGFSFPGVPGVHMGHNRAVNWNATTNFADTMDIFDVAVDDDGYANMGGSPVAIRERAETIHVREADGSQSDREFTIREVPGYGVMLPDDLLPIDKGVFAEGEVMLAWAGFDTDSRELFEFLDYDRSTSVSAMRDAVKLEGVGQQNWVFADATGIGYQAHGHIPVRGGDPRRISDASKADQLWTGEFLAEDLYPMLDGTQDWIGTANNAPFDHAADNDPTNDAFYYGSYFDPGWRADRIETLASSLAARGNITVADMIPMQKDVDSGLAEDLLPMLLATADRIDTDETLADFRGDAALADAIAELRAWDHNMSADSEAAALFHTWQAMLCRRTLGGDMGVLFDAVASATPTTVAKLSMLAHREQIASILDGKGDSDQLASLDDAIAWIDAEKAARGVTSLTWGDIHTARFSGPWLPDEDTTFFGDESTVSVADCAAWDGSELNNPCASHEGSIYRAIADFGDDNQPQLWFHVGHGGYGGEDDWQKFTYQYMNFRPAEVDAATVTTWTLAP